MGGRYERRPHPDAPAHLILYRRRPLSLSPSLCIYLYILSLPQVLEIRPVIDWNKGKAVEFLLESLGLADSDDVLPIYIGDDRTDEDAFEVLRRSGRGFGILVSSVPKETKASYSLRDPSEVGAPPSLLLLPAEYLILSYR